MPFHTQFSDMELSILKSIKEILIKIFNNQSKPVAHNIYD